MSMRVKQSHMLMEAIVSNQVSSVLWRGIADVLIPQVGILIFKRSHTPAICRVVSVVIAGCAYEQK
jgi:multidrug transporter EmrE-like cation transporter